MPLASISKDGDNYTVLSGGELTDEGSVSSYFGNLNGVFDGANLTLTGLIKPLFDQVLGSGIVKDLTLSTAASGLTATSQNTGVLAKTSEGTITNVSVSGTIDAAAQNNVGGLVGEVSSGTISSSSSTVIIANGGENIGGLIGTVTITTESSVTVSDSQASGSVTGSNNVGGLIGGVSVTQEVTTSAAVANNTVSNAPVSIPTINEEIQVTVSNSTATGVVQGNNGVGGLIGGVSVTQEVTTLTTVTNINSSESPVSIGTINSEIQVTISNSTATNGEVSGEISVGGLVGSVVVTQEVTTSTTLNNGAGTTNSITTTGDVTANAAVTISNVSVTSTVVGAENLGGVVGTVSTNSSSEVESTVDTSGANASSITTGGVTAHTSVTVSNSTVDVSLSAFEGASGNNVGGIVGRISSEASSSSDLSGTTDGASSSPITTGSISTQAQVSVSGASVQVSTDYVGNNIGGLIGTLTAAPTESSTSNTSTGDSIESPVSNGVISTETPIQVSSSEASGTIIGGDGTGGVIGDATLSQGSTLLIQNVDFGVQGESEVQGSDGVGGLIGKILVDGAQATISGISATGTVSGGYEVGGLIGEVDLDVASTLTINSSTSQVVVAGYGDVGGLMGDIYLQRGSSFSLSSSQSQGNVTGESADVGGLIGILDLRGAQATISTSSAAGSVAGGDDVGGLIGDVIVEPDWNEVCSWTGWGWDCVYEDVINSQLTIEDSFSTSTLISGEDSVGGIVGEISVESWFVEGEDAAAGSVQISNSYSSSEVHGDFDVGGLIGRIEEPDESPFGGLSTLVTGSHATGDVEGRYSVGGLLGYGWYIRISDSYSKGDVAVASEWADCDVEFDSCPDPEYFGGLVGYVYNTYIENTYAQGNVDASGADHVGGLIGEAATGLAFNNQILTTHSNGDVIGRHYVGGLIGFLEGNSLLENSYASGDVNASGDAIGGLVGSATGFSLLENIVSLGDVVGVNNVGGLVGELSGVVENAVALGDVVGEGRVGGLVGNMAEESFSVITNSSAYGNINLTGPCSSLPLPPETCHSIGGLVGYMNYSNEINDSFATGDVRGGGDVGGLVGIAYGPIRNSWAEGEVLSFGLPGEPFVGYCVTEAHYCDMDVIFEDEEVATNYDPEPLSSTLPPSVDLQLEILDHGLDSAFALNECINAGLPYLLSLTESYSNSCEGDGGEDDSADDSEGEGDSADDSDSRHLNRMRVLVISKTTLAAPLEARNFTPTKTAIPATCIFRPRSANSNLNDSKLILGTATESRFLSRVVLKTIDSFQLKIDGFTGKNFGIWINDPNCGQVKFGSTSLNDESNEAILIPIEFTKYGDFVVSFFMDDSDTEVVNNKLPEFQVLLQVNDNGVDYFWDLVRG